MNIPNIHYYTVGTHALSSGDFMTDLIEQFTRFFVIFRDKNRNVYWRKCTTFVQILRLLLWINFVYTNIEEKMNLKKHFLTPFKILHCECFRYEGKVWL